MRQNENSQAGVARFRVDASTVHGRGLFAVVDFAAGSFVIEYTGELITKAESLKRCEAGNEYIFSLDDDTDLDGSRLDNLARFINHSCNPNCEACLEEGRIIVRAARDVSAGEELSFNYGYDLEDYKEHPCRCGAAQCVGFMVAEEFFPRFSSPAVCRLATPAG